jgi:endonuclease III
MDRQIKTEKAWIIPHLIAEKLGTFSIEVLAKLSGQEVTELMAHPEPLHRRPNVMGGFFHSAVQRIAMEYSGDAARIWTGNPSSAEVVYRFLEFDGVGPKIATMATNLLARDHKIPLSDYFSIDISADVHVRRVFERLGLCPPDASVEQIVYKARALNPEFPGMLDLSSWEIGRKWCDPHTPRCGECYMNDVCPMASSKLTA